MRMRWREFGFQWIVIWQAFGAVAYADQLHPSLTEASITSSADASQQPCLVYFPTTSGPTPLLVALHSWSGDYRQTYTTGLVAWCVDNDWAFVQPNFRGPNRSPAACASDLAVADIVDAVEFARRCRVIDDRHIYLIGSSGGGHMSLVMAGRTPGLWAGVSAWVPIFDLSDWYRESKARQLKYADDLMQVCGGPPDGDHQVQHQYVRRSPLTYLNDQNTVPVQIHAGIRDGHDGSVPVSHSLRAFNAMAHANDRLAKDDIHAMTANAAVPDHLRADPSELHDPSFGKKQPLFRRRSNHVEVTIFDGGHEYIESAAIAWLNRIAERRNSANTGQIASAVTVVAHQSHHPVLIRKDHNPVIRLTINAPTDDIFLERLRFSLAGTDDAKDVDSVAVYLDSQGGELSTERQFGDHVAAAPEVELTGHFRLRQGDNHLWVAIRLNEMANLDHSVTVACSEVLTSHGVATLSASAPVAHHIGVALRRHWDDGVHTYRIPALATTARGTLLCVYDARRRSSRDLQEDIDIGLSRSTDGGQTWEAQQIIMDMHTYGGRPQHENGCSDPGIIVDPQTGEIHVFAVWTWGRPKTHQWNVGGSEPGLEIGVTAQFLGVTSRDDGKTWGPPVNLTRRIKRPKWILLAPSPQQGIALDDGTLVMPVQGRNAEDEKFSTVMISRDHGETWLVRTPYAEGNNECQAAVLGDGSIMLNCRTERPTKFRTVAVSSDLGHTWTAHESNRKALIEPNCNGSLYRFDLPAGSPTSHVLLFANPHTQTDRSRHTLQVSFDDGKTWPKPFRRLLDDGRGRGYPSISRVDDQRVALVYEGSQADLVFERFRILDLIQP